MEEKVLKTSGLLLPLKLLSLTTGKHGAVSMNVRREVTPLMRRNMGNVSFIPPEEIPVIRQYVEDIRSFDPVLADEIAVLVAKYTNL